MFPLEARGTTLLFSIYVKVGWHIMFPLEARGTTLLFSIYVKVGWHVCSLWRFVVQQYYFPEVDRYSEDVGKVCKIVDNNLERSFLCARREKKSANSRSTISYSNALVWVRSQHKADTL